MGEARYAPLQNYIPYKIKKGLTSSQIPIYWFLLNCVCSKSLAQLHLITDQRPACQPMHLVLDSMTLEDGWEREMDAIYLIKRSIYGWESQPPSISISPWLNKSFWSRNRTTIGWEWKLCIFYTNWFNQNRLNLIWFWGGFKEVQ